MRGLLVRVGADSGEAGGYWNAPVDSSTGDFAYVAIPETYPIRPGHARPYSLVASHVGAFGVSLPPWLGAANMHLDPDFSHLTYGDQGMRASQILSKVGLGDLLVFYAAFADIHPSPRLVYALIGLYVINRIVPSARSVPPSNWHLNAHTRRDLAAKSTDMVVHARQDVSGRLRHCIPIGSFRPPKHDPKQRPCYRVDSSILKAWGGLNVSDGYIHRSARLPEFLNARRFYRWFRSHDPVLVQQNNLT